MKVEERIEAWKHRRAVQRVQPGDGRPLKRFRWWQPLSRTLMYLPVRGDDGQERLYAVDVHHWRHDDDGHGRADLHLDGQRTATSRLPAVFPVDGGVVEVAQTSFGLRRCHYVTADGVEHQLTPDPRSAEGVRARLAREHPAASRVVGVVTALLLVVPLLLLLLQVAEGISGVPPLADRFGTFTSPVALSTWQNVALTLVAAAASTERAMRLRYSALLDGS